MIFRISRRTSLFSELPYIVKNVLEGYLDIFVTAYMDDIVIYSITLKEHKKHVKLVFERLREAWLLSTLINASSMLPKSLFSVWQWDGTALKWIPKN